MVNRKQRQEYNNLFAVGEQPQKQQHLTTAMKIIVILQTKTSQYMK